PTPNKRIVHHGDGVAWLEAADLASDHAIVTSLPDHSELPALGVEGWREWFVNVAALACEKTADDAVTIFFQTDVKHEGRWIDKGYLVSRGAEHAGCHLLWHKVACRAKPGIVTFGRPAYAHLLCFSRSLRLELAQSSADILPSLGKMVWPRAMGADICDAVATFLLAHTPCRTVIDPFCGQGTMLAVANARGLDAIGVELSRKRAKKAQALQL
ncbi:MAG: SAM-dependent methyltransferase, partial [Deltaproteobacteria bacterium]|nr:SAM-dependent methyltransferase [Deltaproteobacteria bacterium]